MYYILMIVSILLGTMNSLLLRQYGLGREISTSELFLFNAGTSLVWAVALTVWLLLAREFFFSPITFLFGIIYGLIIGLFQLFKTASLNAGPVSITSLVGSYAFIVPIIYAYIALGEKPTPAQIIGTAVITIALILCINPKFGAEKMTKRWVILSFLFFCFGGILGVFYRFFGESQVHTQVTLMMITASVVAAAVFWVFGKKTGAQSSTRFISRRSVLFMIMAGLAECIYMRVNFVVSVHVPSVLFFPCVNGSMVVLVALGGRIFFREKHSALQVIGFVLAVLGLIINGCGEAVFSTIIQQ